MGSRPSAERQRIKRTAREIGAVGVVVLAMLVAWSLSKGATAEPLTRSPGASPRDPTVWLYYFPYVSWECLAFPPLEWDPRLGPGGLPHLGQVRIIPANVAQGQKFWRVIKVKFEDVYESGNDHSIYVKVLGENCLRVDGEKLHLTSEGGLSEYPEEKSAGDLCDCNFAYPMYGDGYNVQIESQYPSDMVAGMIMPMRRHVNYRITFQLATQP